MSSLGPILHALGLPSVASTSGASYIGIVIGMMLYGLTVHQGYRYFKLYPKDRVHLKILVSVIFLLETVHTVVWMYIGYHYLVSESFNVAGSVYCHWFYCFRVYLIGGRYKWLVIPAVATMTAGFTFGMIAGIKAFIFVRELTDLHRISWLVSVAYGLVVATDVILTGSLVFVLYQSRTSSKSILDTLIVYTINTALLTSIVSVLAFAFGLVIPGNLIYASVSIIGVKLYANSVLALLNSRRSIDDKFMDDFTTFSIPDLQVAPGSRAAGHAPRGESDTMIWDVRQVSTSPILHVLGFPSVASTLGATYIGLVIGTMLYGLTVHQGYRYYKLYPTDMLYIKVLSMAVYSCQTFYCFRVFLIGPRYRWLVIPAVVSMTTGFSFGVVAGVEAFVFVRELTELHRISWMVSVAYGFAVSSDLILTGALDQQYPGHPHKYTINTGLLTSIVSVFAFVFALVIPGNLIYAAVSIVGAKLYANSVLALLNSRRSIDNRYMDDFTTFNISDLNTPERTQAHRGESDTMVWNVRQVSTCMSQTTSISQGMTFATGTTPHTSDVNISV
ncbi:hypothetical protein ACG7TL_008320 [Trametes sanguinea]